MKIFLVYWPNNSFSIISASSYYELMWNLDFEGNPYDAVFADMRGVHLVSNDAGGSFSFESVWMPDLGKKNLSKFNWHKLRIQDEMDKNSTAWNRFCVEEASTPDPVIELQEA